MTKDVAAEPFELRNGGAAGTIIFLCDHAANDVPHELGTLGLPPSDFASHIAYDIGAAGLTRGLADRFEAPAILGRWSRLVIDLNRGADDPTVVMKLSDGRIVPGNRAADRTGVAERIARYHAPYHEAIAARIAAGRSTDRAGAGLHAQFHAHLAREGAALAYRHPVGGLIEAQGGGGRTG